MDTGESQMLWKRNEQNGMDLCVEHQNGMEQYENGEQHQRVQQNGMKQDWAGRNGYKKNGRKRTVRGKYNKMNGSKCKNRRSLHNSRFEMK
jgi:hypothetical protein